MEKGLGDEVAKIAEEARLSEQHEPPTTQITVVVAPPPM